MRILTTLLFVLINVAFVSAGQVEERVLAAQRTGVRFTPVSLFERLPAGATTDASWRAELKLADVLQFDHARAASLLQQGAPAITLTLPASEGNLHLDLLRTELSREELVVRVASTGEEVRPEAGVHYRGVVRGSAGSIVAVSVYGDAVMMLLSDAHGQLVLGPLEQGPRGLHVLYREHDLRITNPLACHVEEDGRGYRPEELHAQEGDRTLRCVRYYWEVNYDIFQNKGSVANTVNYVTGLFNQSAILFDNDGIDVTLSEVFVWDVPSPYVQTTTSGLLDQFGVTRTSFNGDMAHLLGFAGGGGLAWLNTLCNGQTRLRMAYSDINATYSNVPTYSWSVMVVTHEQGHNLGSRHTHACAWNGDNTAIDGCGPTAGYTEGTCPTGPLPTGVGGTIMSYCHLVGGVGINFNNGFGPQPTAVMVNRVNASACLAACGTSCDPPGNLFATGITVNSANLSWAAIGASGYTLRWRAVGAPAWNEVTGLTSNTYALTGLTQTTAYEFQVLSVCEAASSAYSGTYTFSTLAPCPDAFEPNNSLVAAAQVVLPLNTNALIASQTDVDYYRFTISVQSNISLFLGNLAGDYDVRILDAGGSQLAISQNGSTNSENILLQDQNPGTYYVHVYGYNGAFSSTQCYVLTVNAITQQGCTMPESIDVNNITHESALVTWASVPGAISYDLRYKLSSGSEWTVLVGFTTTSHTLSGLLAVTEYDVQVRSVCQGQAGTQGGSTSAYTPLLTFETLPVPCEVAPPSVVAVRVLLDGPYNAGSGLMVDSLRAKGLLPLMEPYTALGHAVDGPLLVDAAVLANSGNNAIVDWVLVELREGDAPHAVVEARAGLLQRDGDVVGVDGQSPLGFCSPPDNYRIAVRHRNHLGCMTGSTFALSSTSTVVDLRLSAAAIYGTNARKVVGNLRTLWSGNVLRDGVLRYTGSANDRDPILSAVGGSVPTGTAGGYRAEDVNMDGEVRYVGAGNDRDPILSNIGGSVPTATLVEQLP
ncbi:MAG: fibronectin type III domain-containing protein [Flavobacteriales bacterium]